MPDITKRCGKCREIKNSEDFPRDKSRPDGRYSYCNACNTARVTAINRKKTLERQEAKRLHAIANPITQKTCSGCKTVKALSEFQKEDGGLAGHRSQCNACRNIKDRHRYFSDLDSAREKGRERAARLSKHLSDGYIKALITRKSFIRNADVPQQLVDLKRIQLRIKRMIEVLEDEKR